MRKNPPTVQTPRERDIPGNERVTAPSGKTTWKYKTIDDVPKGEKS